MAYRAYVCTGETTSGALSYSLNNESWLNDHQSHRLYDDVEGWTGTTFEFDKKIVDSVEDTGTGKDSSHICEGQTVVYRLSLRSLLDQDGNKSEVTLTGKDIYDALPLSISSYRWSRDNIKITYPSSEDVTVTNGESWNVLEADTSDQQYIRWGDDFSITFKRTAYIYVELNYPSDAAWQEYAIKYGTSTLTNSFYVLSVQSSVTHDLSVAAQVRLQKGVESTGYIYTDGSSSYVSKMSSQDSRRYYQNNDSMVRAVQYYVALYNGGSTNLYLTDMQDLLPEGFTYAFGKCGNTCKDTGFDTDTTMNDSVTEIRKGNVRASKKHATVNVMTGTGANGQQMVTFNVARPKTDESSNIAYDSDRKMCYLKPGESLVFTFVCKTNEAANTEDASTNTIAMPYYDFNGGGVQVDTTGTVVSVDSKTYTPNDGECDVSNNGEAENLGFTGGANDTQWLMSNVTVIRGSIKPGITKALTSTTSQDGNVTKENPIFALPTDTLNWTLTTENDGMNSLTDYVLTDRMQSPYMFTGKVSYEVYDHFADSVAVAKPSSDYLFTIAADSEDSDSLSVTTNKGVTQQKVTIGGDPITLTCEWNYNGFISDKKKYRSTKDVEVKLAIAKDADGNAVLSLHFPDATMGIPECGSGKLTLSTNNTTNILENKQFINTCYVTPLAQTWDNTTNKGNITTLDTSFNDGRGELSTVRNSAPVNVAYSYGTSSSKSVTEIDNESNKAVCTDDQNYIVLPDKTKEFRYTLSVDNCTDKAMSKLILIDGLPDVNDHTAFQANDLRFSEFKVSLTESPNFSVTVTAKGGTVTILDAKQYTIEYAAKTEFTSEDWKGSTTWSSDAAGARSVRVKILDSTDSLIPPDSTVSVSFNCKIDGDAEPGQVAWNSFGYHYSMSGLDSELEAAPLKVGVKLPSIPALEKQVVDHSGQARAVDKDTTFSFLVYEGEALSGSYATEGDLVQALKDNNRNYDTFAVIVKARQSLSDALSLQTDKLTWTEGKKYTIVELPFAASDGDAASGSAGTATGKDYAFKRFLNSAANTYTLTYTAGETQIVICENTALCWGIHVEKVNENKEALSGAVFALYSPNEKDTMTEAQLASVQESYKELLKDDKGNVITAREFDDGKTWYLKSVVATGDTGELNWSGLYEEEYYLLEVKAPDGYKLNSPAGQILKRDKEKQGIYSVTVVNQSGSILPKTGGAGTFPFTIGGTLLLAGSLMSGYVMRRRRKGGL